MPRIKIPLGVGSYESVSVPFAAQRCINLYAAVAEAQALNDMALFGTPGVVSFGTVGTLPSRGATVMNGVYYVITGTTLYSVDELGAETSLGTIAGSGRVSMAHNGEKLCIVAPGGNGYEWNKTTTTLTQITDVDYRTADTVCFKDGYYIFTATASDVFFNSALNDPLTFDALDFGTAELAPDGIIGCHVNHDEVYILGEYTTEVFQNVGGAGFPFQRVPGASFEKGAHSKFSPIQWEGSFYFIGGGINEKSSIWAARGTAEPTKVSTDAIDHEIQKFTRTEIAAAFSFTYSIGGASFVGFTFRSVNIDSRTFVYNVTASKSAGRPAWFEQQTGVVDNAWRAESVTNVYDKLIVSDVTDGRLGYLDAETYTEYSNTLTRVKTTGPFANGGSSVFMSELELTVDAGAGNITGSGDNPVVMFDFSDDGARTWSSEFVRELGKIGEYFKRAIWRRLGRIPAHRVFRFRISDPVRVALIKLEGRVTNGR